MTAPDRLAERLRMVAEFPFPSDEISGREYARVFREAADFIESTATPVPGVSDAMVLVPREPTEAMKSAFHSTRNCVLDGAGFAVPIWSKQYEAMLEAAVQSPPAGGRDADADACPICEIEFKSGDTCATDIELGMCHAACLEGSPTVDLDTGEPIDGPVATYPYEQNLGTDDRAFLSPSEAGVTTSPDGREAEESPSPAPVEAVATEPVAKMTMAEAIKATENVEMPDDLRIPLNALQSDLDYLFSRVIEDPTLKPLLLESAHGRLSEIEGAIWNILFGRALVHPTGDSGALRALVEVEDALHVIASLSHSEEGEPVEQLERIIEANRECAANARTVMRKALAALASGEKAP